MAPRSRIQQGDFVDLFPHFVDASWICKWMDIPLNLEHFIQSVYAGEGNGVSDGSFIKALDLCSAGWIITTSTAEIRGGGCVPTPHGESSAYRAELSGLLGLVLVLHMFETWIPPTEPYDIVIGCDGKSALFKALSGDREYFDISCPSFDLLARIFHIREQLKARITPTHVRGHQDRKGKKLTYLETLNVRMDTLAKEILQHHHTHDDELCDALPPIQGGLPILDYQNTPIVSNMASTLLHRISENRLRDYWNKRGRYKVSFAEQWIDWDVVTAVTKESSGRMRKFIAKWVTQQNAVGIVKKRRKECEHDLCPICGEPHEDNLHVLRCPHAASRETWKHGCKSVRKWMRQQKTDPELQHGLYKALKAFGTKENFDRYAPTGYPSKVQECLNAQTHLGWTGFLEGLLTTDWAVCQQEYFQRIGSKRTGHRWAVGLSKQIWKLVFEMWQHRNHCLHNSGADNILRGIDIVDTAIQFECSLGLGSLDQIYSTYFDSPHTLLQQTSRKKRQWLSLIRRGRESQNYKYDDEIAINDSLRKWIGLPPSRRKKRHSTSTSHEISRTGYIG